MKYYTRQIRPYLRPHPTPGSLCVSWAVEGYDWVPEEMEAELKKEIVFDESLSQLIFKERFVEVSNEQI